MRGPLTAALLGCTRLIGAPTLIDQEGQIVYPVVLTHAARIDHVGEIVLRVRHNEIGVCDSIIALARLSFLGGRNSDRFLNRAQSGFISRESDEPLVEIVEPAPEYLRGVSCRIGGNENE